MTPLPIRLYRVIANALAPRAYLHVTAKLADQGVAPERLTERRGDPNAPRPTGTLIWFHAASVGESLSVLRLITHMGTIHPDWSFLMTSGTATSAEIVGNRLPPRTTHHFAPLDAHAAIQRFLAHWNPSAAIFVESELWPQMITLTYQAGVPMALLNARISERSAQKWKRFSRSAHYLLRCFKLIHTQDTPTTTLMHELGLPHAYTGQNLKSVSGPLPFDADAAQHLKMQIGNRPLWLASSTHPGEDAVMLDAHQTLLQKHPDALLILVPRHPERAGDIEALLQSRNLEFNMRSRAHVIDDTSQIYLADTLGETGLWYHLSPITCLCGSFTPVGGHNPYEPAYAGSVVLHGPLYANFAQTYAAFDHTGGALQVDDAQILSKTLLDLLENPETLSRRQRDARGFADAQSDMLAGITEKLSQALALR